MSVTIEEGGTILRGLAVPFGEYAPILKNDELFAEVFDADSLAETPQNVPLLMSHRRDEPAVGRVVTSWADDRGLHIEARLVASDDALEGWRRRFRDGLTSSLSIGFTGRHKYEKPQRPGGLPIGRVRKARIVELSLVNWPAYASAAVERVSVRTALEEMDRRQGEKRHAEHVVAVAMTRHAIREAEPFLRRRR